MKEKRHAKILELIRTGEIETQEELALALEESGFVVTQATVSRDIRELNLIKMTQSDGKQKYSLSHYQELNLHDRYYRVLQEGFVSMELAMNLLVIKTVSGMAMAVAAAFDHLELPEIVGCIAGDDTIMCAMRSIEEAQLIQGKIQQLIS